MNKKLIEAKRQQLRTLQEKKLSVLEKAKQYEIDNRIEFFKPNTPQAKLLQAFNDPRYEVLVFTGGNRSGKTTILVIILISCLLGFWLWSGEKIIFPHNSPRQIRLVCEDWEHSAQGTVIKELNYWWPKNHKLKTKNNSQGYTAFWQHVESKSMLEIVTNKMDIKAFEGWKGDVIGYDEPPIREKRIALARGLVDRNGVEIFSATLLDDPWMHKEIIKGRDDNGRPLTNVFHINATTFDNLGFGLNQKGIDTLMGKLRPEEIQARIYGKPGYLRGLVYPEFDRSTHFKKPFPIPSEYIVDISIDLHPSKPQAVLFMATCSKNYKYIFYEIYKNIKAKSLAEEIMRYVNSNLLRVGRIIIDPLAKGDKNNDQTSYQKIENVLLEYGYPLECGSKEEKLGTDAFKDLLITQNNEAGVFVFNNLARFVEEIEEFMFETKGDKIGQPVTRKFHMMENVRRLTLLDTQWYSRRDKEDNEPIDLIGNSPTGY